MSEPRGEESYCRDCWDKKIAVEEIVAREFALKRYIRAPQRREIPDLPLHAEASVRAADRGGRRVRSVPHADALSQLRLRMNRRIHLEGDPEGRLFSELLVDVVAAEVIEPWGGGKWHMEIVRYPCA
ncbi:MAG: hypothetical protein QM736_28175 [Vicinamibacterales bacterium]